MRSLQNYDMIVPGRDIKLNVLLLICDWRPYNFEPSEFRTQRLLKPVRRLVLSVDISVPAVKRLHVSDSDNVRAIVLVAVCQVGVSGLLRAKLKGCAF